MTVQVLVVGAGPVGLTMAAELARYRVPVRIIDKAAQRTDKSKALVLWSRTLELLERAGCAGALVAAGRQITAANFVAGAKALGRVNLTGLTTPYSFALMLPQAETERLLEAHLASLGITVERQVEAVGFTADAAGVSGTLRHPDGREEILRTDWLVGCDGAHSVVRHQLGVEFEGETLNSDWLLAYAGPAVPQYRAGDVPARSGSAGGVSDHRKPLPDHRRYRCIEGPAWRAADLGAGAGGGGSTRAGGRGAVRSGLVVGLPHQRA